MRIQVRRVCLSAKGHLEHQFKSFLLTKDGERGYVGVTIKMSKADLSFKYFLLMSEFSLVRSVRLFSSNSDDFLLCLCVGP